MLILNRRSAVTRTIGNFSHCFLVQCVEGFFCMYDVIYELVQDVETVFHFFM